MRLFMAPKRHCSALFDTRVRYTGISTVYQVSGIVSSSITPLIATTLLKANDGQPWYMPATLSLSQ